MLACYSQCGALARSTCSYDTDRLPPPDLEACASQNSLVTKALVDILEFDEHIVLRRGLWRGWGGDNR